MPGQLRGGGEVDSLSEWWRLASQGAVVRRGLKFAVVVGATLIAINHGDEVVSGDLTRASYVKMGLTVLVPYVVSVLSSVGAMVHEGREKSEGPPAGG